MDKIVIDSAPYLAGVIGHPISHSKSPKLHNYWLKKYELNGFDLREINKTHDMLQIPAALSDLKLSLIHI